LAINLTFAVILSKQVWFCQKLVSEMFDIEKLPVWLLIRPSNRKLKPQKIQLMFFLCYRWTSSTLSTKMHSTQIPAITDAFTTTTTTPLNLGKKPRRLPKNIYVF
jgi:hypothetical protein